jgi:hypothetical protein
MRAASALETAAPAGEHEPKGIQVREPAAATPGAAELIERFRRVRRFSEELCQTLEPEDCVVQTMPEMSPTKWHLAHTSWFFETFVVKPHWPRYRPLHPRYAFLSNSYYNVAGQMRARPQRGPISRPTVRQTYAYGQHVNAAREEVVASADEAQLALLRPLIVLGLNHEQQHQELILTDIRHAFWMNVRRAGRIEMHLVSRCRQAVAVDGHRFTLRRGESIVTEHSYKYTLSGFRRLAGRAGYAVTRVWTDSRRWFGVHYPTPRPQENGGDGEGF